MLGFTYTLMIHGDEGDLGPAKFERSASLLGIYKSFRRINNKTQVADQRWQAGPSNLIKQKL